MSTTSYQLPEFASIDLLQTCGGSYVNTSEVRATSMTELTALMSQAYFGCAYDSAMPVEALQISVHDAAADSNYVRFSGGDLLAPSTGLGDRVFTANASKRLDDVIAYGGGRAAIAHDIDLRGGPRAVEIDLTTGAPFERFTPDVAAVDADETVDFHPSLETKNSAVEPYAFADQTLPLALFDRALLEPGDYMSVYAGADSMDHTTARWLNRTNDLIHTHWEWLPRLTNVAIAASTTSSSVPRIDDAYTMVSLECWNGNYGTGTTELVVESTSWREAHDPESPGSIAFDEAVAGWDPGWTPTTENRSCRFAVTNTLSPGNNDVTAFNSGGAMVSLLPRRPNHRR